MNTSSYGPAAVVLLVCVALLYMLPTLIAVARGSRRTLLVATINVLTGWTIGGWVWSLILAAWQVNEYQLVVLLALMLWSMWRFVADDRQPWPRWRGLWALNVVAGFAIITLGSIAPR